MIDFPASPSIGQVFTTAGLSWRYNGTNWVANTGATPAEYFAFAGLQINGDMQISQENGQTARTTLGYIMDGWRFGFAGTSVTPANQVLGSAPPGLPAFLRITVTTAQASLAAGDYVQALQPVEGLRIARLSWGNASAQPLTIAFWTAHHRIGAYSVSIRNAATNRAYATTYTQNVADAWEYKTVTIPGDTTGTWATDTTVGMYIGFCMAVGTTYTVPVVNTWSAGNYLGAPGQVNGVAATSDVFRLAGVLFLPGSVAPVQANAPFCFRPYDQELALCMRYYQKSYAYATAPGTNTGLLGGIIDAMGPPVTVEFKVTMRANPAVTPYDDLGNAGRINNNGTANVVPTATDNINEKRFKVYHAANRMTFHYVADARL